MRRIAVLALIASASACTLLTSLDGLTGGDAQVDGAISPREDAPGEGRSAADARAEDDIDAGSPDAACVRRPTLAFDVTPDGSAGFTCDLPNILALDGLLGGLDSNSGPNGTLAGESVSSCVLAGFDADLGSRIDVYATQKASACGGACTGGCSGVPRLKVFAGPSEAALAYLGVITIDLDAGLMPYTMFRPPGPGARVVVLCRAPSSTYEDIAIDVVETDCP